MLPSLRRASRSAVVTVALTVAATLVGVACGSDNGVQPTPTVATETPTPVPATATPTPATPAPTVAPNGDPGAPDLPHDQQARDTLLRLAFDLPNGTESWPDVDAVAIRLQPIETDPGQELWFAVTTGRGVTERLGARSHVAGMLVRRPDGGWTEVALYTLQSTPFETEPQLVHVTGGGDVAWIGVFGSVAGAATTFELLRFDGAAFSPALWWFARGADAARLIDLNENGTPEIVLDGANRSVLCQGCDVVAFEEVIYRWSGDRLVLVEIVALDRDGEVAALVDDAVAQVRADLWREAAATFQEAVQLDPSDQEVWWMSLLAGRIADARLAHAGAAAQPLLTHVLAGEHDAAAELMRAVDPADAFDPTGALMAGTDGLRAPGRMAELLIDYASRAIGYDPERHAAYVVRALGVLLDDPDRIGEARADLEHALELQPEDDFYQAALAYLEEIGEGATPETDEQQQ